ncbi:MAG: hypothetical protein QG621_241 [Patescibacteria group bacterium]|jgi:type IV secretory pathway VirB2 component (pilin)|nr:hypothetical protein [Patescibacteria group bacterium]
MLNKTDIAVVVGIILLLSFLTTLLIRKNNPRRQAYTDQQPPANNSPTPAGRKINWFGWTKRRWFWWPVLALAAAIAVFFAWQHLPPTSFPIVGAWGTSGNQSDAVSWQEWLQQPTDTVFPGTRRATLAVIGILVLCTVLILPYKRKKSKQT